jgi:hypothetical protein
MNNRVLLLVVPLMVALFAPGCGPCDAKCVEHDAQVFETATKAVAYDGILPLLPKDEQAEVEQAFDEAFAALDDAVEVLVDVDEAVTAGESGDLAGAEQAVSDAIGSTIALVDGFLNPSAAIGPAVRSKVKKVSLPANLASQLDQARQAQADIAQVVAQ